jgi:hypothetical protein
MAPCAAPILHYMVGWPDDRVRAYVKEQDWKASIVTRPAIHQHEESFEVRWPELNFRPVPDAIWSWIEIGKAGNRD